MKKTWIVLCSAIALVGCDQNRGGAGSDSNRDAGAESSRDSTYRNTTPGSMTTTNTGVTSPVTSPSGANASGTRAEPATK